MLENMSPIYPIGYRRSVMQYDTRIQLSLAAGNDPSISFGIDEETIYTGKIHDSYLFIADLLLTKGTHCIWIEFECKDPNRNDQHVEIEYVEFEGMRLDRVKWQGIYQPKYPQPWASEQLALGNTLPPFRRGETWLGWYGRWSLVFEVPIFRWIHSVEHLGWIYD